MLRTSSSSMVLFRFEFYLLLFICCVMTIRSFRIDHHRFDDRHERAVTEWRFRRNFLFPLNNYYPNRLANDHMANYEAMENENGVVHTYDKKYLPNLMLESINK